jgi:hypothetical protein
MQYDDNTFLWTGENASYFQNIKLVPLQQIGPTCVFNTLAVLTGNDPDYFDGKINTQNPISWSDALIPFGMKLAYCSTDVRKMENYLPELVGYDDLFIISYYSYMSDPLADPDENGWVCGSHIVILHRDKIIDSKKGLAVPAVGHEAGECHTKRIFRVVPADYSRGL